jgi:hypothetical protein
MNQILHIFKKDTRRFWPEILVSSVILFAFVWLFPGKWKVYHDQSQFFRIQQFAGLLGLLVPVGWWVLTARVVHAETLVGDEQFWITRPYEWKKLLTAKVLFIAVWVGGPYLLAQSWLLSTGGFHPLSYIPGLLSGLLVALLVFVLAVLAAATVTSTFARLTLTILGGFVAFLAYSFWDSMPRLYAPSHPYENRVLPVLLIVGCVAAIVLQYAMRRVWVARSILLALPVLMLASVSWYGRASLVDRAYPTAGASGAFSGSLAATAEHPVDTRVWNGQDHIMVPVRFSGIGQGNAVFIDDIKFTLRAADGSEWSSSWQGSGQRILADGDTSTTELNISPELYKRFESAPVTLHVTFAVNRYQVDSVTQVPYPAADAAIPGVGFCTPQLHGMPNLHCRAAIDAPRLTYMTVLWSKSGCSDAAHLFEPTAKGNAWILPTGFDPRLALVWTGNYWMGFQETDEERKEHLHYQICPGSPLTLTTFRSLGLGQTDMTLTNFVLPNYVQGE